MCDLVEKLEKCCCSEEVPCQPKHRYTWKKDKLDKRDFKYVNHVEKWSDVPPSVDLRKQFGEIYNQGQLGSCTANAIAMAFNFEDVDQSLRVMNPSRLFIYYNERSMEGTVSQDSGAEIRDGIKSCATVGVCPESMWPYSDQGNQFEVQPSNNCYQFAKNHQLKKYLKLDNSDVNQLKSCLSSGYPFVCGISVYQSFEGEDVAQTGLVPMPQSDESLLGGHAVICLGYDDNKVDADGNQGCFIMRNSWGAQWGDAGHFYLPYAYLTDLELASDFWTMRQVC